MEEDEPRTSLIRTYPYSDGTVNVYTMIYKEMAVFLSQMQVCLVGEVKSPSENAGYVWTKGVAENLKGLSFQSGTRADCTVAAICKKVCFFPTTRVWKKMTFTIRSCRIFLS